MKTKDIPVGIREYSSQIQSYCSHFNPDERTYDSETNFMQCKRFSPLDGRGDQYCIDCELLPSPDGSMPNVERANGSRDLRSPPAFISWAERILKSSEIDPDYILGFRRVDSIETDRGKSEHK